MEINLELAGQGNTRRLVLVQSNGERIEGKWVTGDTTPVLDCRFGKIAWIGGRPVSLDPLGIRCSAHPLRFLVGTNYCHECAAAKHQRNLERDAHAAHARKPKPAIDISKLDINLDIDFDS